MLRRALFLCFLAIIGLCIVLLLNFTASNPTGRRYSSIEVITTEDSQIIGASGESVLAADLRLPNNNDVDQRQCLCSRISNSNGNTCNTCLVQSSDFITRSFRIPDFISRNFIAESKNRRMLLSTYTDQLQQISDYALGAKLLNRPLWVYVRVDTQVDMQFTQLAESTGGGVVYYFAVPGWIDPVDQAARAGLVATAAGVLALGVLEVRSQRKPRVAVIRPVPQPTPTRRDPMRKAHDAADFAQRAKDKTQRRIDIDDEMIDL